MHKKHENAKEELRRLRKSREKTGKRLTVTNTRSSGGLASTRISSVFFGELLHGGWR